MCLSAFGGEFYRTYTCWFQQHRLAAVTWGHEQQAKCVKQCADKRTSAREALEANAAYNTSSTKVQPPPAIKKYGAIEQWRHEPAEWAARAEEDLAIATASHDKALKFLNQTTHVPVLFYSLVRQLLALLWLYMLIIILE